MDGWFDTRTEETKDDGDDSEQDRELDEEFELSEDEAEVDIKPLPKSFDLNSFIAAQQLRQKQEEAARARTNQGDENDDLNSLRQAPSYQMFERSNLDYEEYQNNKLNQSSSESSLDDHEDDEEDEEEIDDFVEEEDEDDEYDEHEHSLHLDLNDENANMNNPNRLSSASLVTPIKGPLSDDRSSMGTTVTTATNVTTATTATTASAAKRRALKDNAIKVAVRCRALNDRELALGSTYCIKMEGDEIMINADPEGTGDPYSVMGRVSRHKIAKRIFSFDYCYGPETEQEQVFEDIGTGVLENAFAGYNASVFAYGQTGSGKTYTMLGQGKETSPEAGLIPRICKALMDKLSENDCRGDPETSCLGTGEESTTYSLEASYVEIYNEKCIDLLAPPPGKGESVPKLRVREDPKKGPYVEDLTTVPVRSMHEIRRMMTVGARTRTVASTNMNNKSSRSHAIFTLVFKQTTIAGDLSSATDTVSKINLVDLAGSERVSASGVKGKHLTEAANINRSLHTLGRVINALSRASSKKATSTFTPLKESSVLSYLTPTKVEKEPVIPYRDSTLTWLLKPSLGGNSRTTMFATVSPATINFEESLTTLRYAQECSRVMNKAVVNRDANTEIIMELRNEIDLLRERLAHHTETSQHVHYLEEANKQMETKILEQVAAKRSHAKAMKRNAERLLQSEAARAVVEQELETTRLELSIVTALKDKIAAEHRQAQERIEQLQMQLDDVNVVERTERVEQVLATPQPARASRKSRKTFGRLSTLSRKRGNSTASAEGLEPTEEEEEIYEEAPTKGNKKSWRKRIKKFLKKMTGQSTHNSKSSTK